MVMGQCELQQVLLLFCVCGKGEWELAADPPLCSWGTSVHLLSQHFSSVMALVLRLRMEGAAPTTQAALDTAAGICACGTKEVLVPHLQLMVKDSEEWMDLWITILCDPGYPDNITQPCICASAGYMELIKLWPILVHLHSPAHSDQ